MDHIDMKRRRGRMLAALACSLSLLAMSAPGAVSVTASRDYVDKKITTLQTNVTSLVKGDVRSATNAVLTIVGSNYVSRVKDTDMAHGVGIVFHGSTNVTHYGSDGVSVKRGAADIPYLFDFANEDGYGIVRKKDLDAILRIVVTNMMGNVYWNSSDGGKTMDAFYREGDMVSNIVNQVNAYMEAEKAKEVAP